MGLSTEGERTGLDGIITTLLLIGASLSLAPRIASALFIPYPAAQDPSVPVLRSDRDAADRVRRPAAKADPAAKLLGRASHKAPAPRTRTTRGNGGTRVAGTRLRGGVL